MALFAEARGLSAKRLRRNLSYQRSPLQPGLRLPWKRIENSSRGVRKKVIHNSACNVPRACLFTLLFEISREFDDMYSLCGSDTKYRNTRKAVVNNLCTIGEYPEVQHQGNVCASASPGGQCDIEHLLDKLANAQLLARPGASDVESHDLVMGDKILMRLSPALLSGMNVQAQLVVLHGVFDRLL